MAVGVVSWPNPIEARSRVNEKTNTLRLNRSEMLGRVLKIIPLDKTEVQYFAYSDDVVVLGGAIRYGGWMV